MRRSARAKTWVLVAAGDGLVDILRNGRQLRASVSLPTAKRYLKQNAKAGDKFLREDPDGLRTAL